MLIGFYGANFWQSAIGSVASSMSQGGNTVCPTNNGRCLGSMKGRESDFVHLIPIRIHKSYLH
jgi:hypothetical protein